jgi:two-component system chemotaxis response regulator CheB
MDSNQNFSRAVAYTMNNKTEPIFHSRSSAFDVVAIAASAGGLDALSTIFKGLPADFLLAIAVVQHLHPKRTSYMVDILKRRTKLKIHQAQDGETLSAGTIFIAPPDWHLLIDTNGRIRLQKTKPVHFVRPSADILFTTLAESYRERAIAVVLTGTGVDGSHGLINLKKAGGTTIAQDQQTSKFFGMPEAAIKTGCVDYILPLEKIAVKLQTLAEGN